jgi:hypothetical protein
MRPPVPIPPLRTYTRDRQSVPVNVDNATVDTVMVIINEYCSLYKCIKQCLTINKLFLNVLLTAGGHCFGHACIKLHQGHAVE